MDMPYEGKRWDVRVDSPTPRSRSSSPSSLSAAMASWGMFSPQACPASAFQTVENYASVKLQEAPPKPSSPSQADEESASLLSAMADLKLRHAETNSPHPPDADLDENPAAEAVSKLRAAAGLQPRREKARRRGVPRKQPSIGDEDNHDRGGGENDAPAPEAVQPAPDPTPAVDDSLAHAPPPAAAPPIAQHLDVLKESLKELWDTHRRLLLRLLVLLVCLIALSDALYWIGYQTLEAYHHHYGIFAGVPPPSPFPPPMPPAPPAAPPPPWIPPGSRIERTRIVGHLKHVGTLLHTQSQ